MTKKQNQLSPKIDEKIITELLSEVSPQELFSKGGLMDQLKKQLVERVLKSELSHELGYAEHSKEGKYTENRRNGSYEKTLLDDDGNKLTIDIPRDREGQYNPQFIPKGVRRFKGFDDRVISLYARGISMSEIQGHLEEIYHTGSI